MKQQIEAMKLALEALEDMAEFSSSRLEKQITDLRQAIEQAQKRPAPMSEPNRIVAYSAAEKLRSLGYQWDEKAAAWQAQKQDPVAWMHWLHGPVRLFLNKDEATMELDRLNREYPVDADGRKMRPLVFGDTSPPQRQPLTDEEINDVCVETYLKNEQPFTTNLDAFKAIARAIEVAHGIKGEA